MSDQLRSTTPQVDSSSFWQHLEKPLTGLLLTFTLLISVEGFPILTAQGAEVPSLHLKDFAEASVLEDLPQPVIPNGVYLYGQSSQAEQVGSTYVVFEVERDRVIGAFYMPQSSFNCFEGRLQPNQMQLTVLDSYEQVSYPYAMAMQPDASLAGRQGTAISSATAEGIAPVALPGYHSLTSLSDTDHRLVATCKQRLSNS